LECFKYCFEKWDDPQDFWNITFNLTKIIDKIDFDDPVWRKLFSLDLSKNPTIQEKVENKKKEIEKIQEEIKNVLKDILPNDIIQYCIHPFI